MWVRVSFGLAPRIGELSLSDPKTPETFNSPLWAWNPERTSDSNYLQYLGTIGQTRGPGAWIPRDKRSADSFPFFGFRGGEINLFDLPIYSRA